MLRIRLKIDMAFLDRFDALLRMKGPLAEQGVLVGTQVESYDVLFIQDVLWRQEFAALNIDNNRPLIVFERSDSAVVSTESFKRVLIQQDNVRAWVKETTLRDPALHNSGMMEGRYHFTKILDEADDSLLQQPNILLGHEALSKIRLILPLFGNPRFNSWRSLQERRLGDRDIDVVFAGSTIYKSPLLTRHRKAACQAILKLNRKSIIGAGRVFTRKQFQSLLLNCKIFVSPYGTGEFSWKDFEAIYAGCVLVKPISHFVATYGFDIFEQGRYCVECRPDFSDLDDITSSICEALPRYEAFARNARHALRAAGKTESFVHDLIKFFRSL